jgi:hypothetical protein
MTGPPGPAEVGRAHGRDITVWVETADPTTGPCPVAHCNARPGYPCRDRAGNNADPHPQRTARTCNTRWDYILTIIHGPDRTDQA